MKTMKAAALAVWLWSLILALSIGVQANVVSIGDASNTKDVIGVCVPSTPEYHVIIEWTDMSFCYDTGKTMVWDADNNRYVEQVNGWNHDGVATVRVTNGSNVAITVDVIYTPAQNNLGVVGTLTNGSFVLPSAAGMPDNAPELSATATFSVADQIPNVSLTNEPIHIGTITVQIAS